MILRTKKTLALCSAVVASSLLVSLAGCGRSGSRSKLPPAQADAVAKLEAVTAQVGIRDGKVVYVDFYTVVDTASAVVHLKDLPDVQKLNFSSAKIGDDDLVHLAELGELQELALNNTQVTDQGLVHLAGLKNLTILNLNEDDVTDAGLVHLKDLKQLKQLHLNDTKVSDAGLEHLAGLEQLEWLLVYGTSVTPGGAASFRERNPETQVVTTAGETGSSDESNDE